MKANPSANSTSSSQRLLNRPDVEQIVITVPATQHIPETAESIRQLLRVRHAIASGRADDFFVREPDNVVDDALSTPTMLLVIMLVLSLVTIVAAGLVIRDLMLETVMKESNEIALRRAMGMRASDVSRRFLLEALIVALAGGVLGISWD